MFNMFNLCNIHCVISVDVGKNVEWGGKLGAVFFLKSTVVLEINRAWNHSVKSDRKNIGWNFGLCVCVRLYV